MRTTFLPIVWTLAALGCAGVPPVAEKVQGTTPHVLPFVEDDYARALADARARGVPLFVEAWAPW